jgi:hypothetical protein
MAQLSPQNKGWLRFSNILPRKPGINRDSKAALMIRLLQAFYTRGIANLSVHRSFSSSL